MGAPTSVFSSPLRYAKHPANMGAISSAQMPGASIIRHDRSITIIYIRRSVVVAALAAYNHGLPLAGAMPFGFCVLRALPVC